jgi:hypothetical protein
MRKLGGRVVERGCLLWRKTSACRHEGRRLLLLLHEGKLVLLLLLHILVRILGLRLRHLELLEQLLLVQLRQHGRSRSGLGPISLRNSRTPLAVWQRHGFTRRCHAGRLGRRLLHQHSLTRLARSKGNISRQTTGKRKLQHLRWNARTSVSRARAHHVVLLL